MVANYSVYPVSCGFYYQWLEKPVTHNYTLTFGWLHVWLSFGTCWMKLWLKVFLQCHIVLCPCKTTIKEQHPVTFTPKSQQKHKVRGMKSLGHVRNGWSSSKHMYGAVLCVFKHTRTYALQCSQEVALVPCHLSSLVMAARLLG